VTCLSPLTSGYLTTPSEIHQWLAQKRLDFRHKNVIITGGHEGVGREVTKALAHLGARIWVMAARTEECDPVVQQIIQETSNSRIECQFMDPGNLDSVEVRYRKVETEQGC
jgi:NAD(P)-dependent dehydrogenase (short-subunit alcohol dehydrogenase family)